MIPRGHRTIDSAGIQKGTVSEIETVPLEVPPRFELGIRVLQTHALPLGYGTIGDPYESWTRYSAVKGRRLSRLTNGPFMVAAVGFEPTTCRVWTGRSGQLSYAAIKVALKLYPLTDLKSIEISIIWYIIFLYQKSSLFSAFQLFQMARFLVSSDWCIMLER